MNQKQVNTDKLLKEYRKVKAKADRLEAFWMEYTTTSDGYSLLHDHLLAEQLEGMQKYHHALLMRLELLGIKVDD